MLQAPSIGTLEKVAIGNTSTSGSGGDSTASPVSDSWLLSRLEVRELSAGVSTEFGFDDWIDNTRPRVVLSPTKVRLSKLLIDASAHELALPNMDCACYLLVVYWAGSCESSCKFGKFCG